MMHFVLWLCEKVTEWCAFLLHRTMILFLAFRWVGLSSVFWLPLPSLLYTSLSVNHNPSYPIEDFFFFFWDAFPLRITFGFVQLHSLSYCGLILFVIFENFQNVHDYIEFQTICCPSCCRKTTQSSLSDRIVTIWLHSMVTEANRAEDPSTTEQLLIYCQFSCSLCQSFLSPSKQLSG